MKQCPVCKTTYTDETLSYCLADGGTLFSVNEAEQPTQISYGRNPMQVNIPPNTSPNTFAPNTVQQVQPGRSVLPFVIIAFLVVLLIGVIGVGAVLFFNPFGKDTTAVLTNTNANTTNNLATNSKTNSQTDELQEKLANLEKKLQEQQNQRKTSNAQTMPTMPKNPTNPGRPTASVKPTSDGFLSLRTEPSVKTGTQLVKIPSGSTVNLENCETAYVTIDSRRGRWCMVTYNNQTGWVFDAFLNY
ncbi:MAG: hypothetical protein LUM44_09250 [Pyrinomonadaceae bacterium]|nr:hypothetical protein [Pyrinomonadaceae bacterium]